MGRLTVLRCVCQNASMAKVRHFRFPDDRAAALSFIAGALAFEHDFEPNRRLDGDVAEAYLAVLLKAVAEREGQIFVAEDSQETPVGWGVVHLSDDDVYVVDAQRRFAYIAELYVVERMRAQGIGRALIAACEDWARERGIGVMQIGALPGNVRAHGIYRMAGYGDYGVQLRKYLR